MNSQTITQTVATVFVTLLIGVTPAFAGGANGGGGNPTNVSVAGGCDVYEAISAAGMILPWMVRTYLNEADPNAPYQQDGPVQILTRDPAKTQHELDSIHWQINDSTPCYHRNDQGKIVAEAGAGIPATSTICLSGDVLIKDHIPSSIVNQKVLTLAFREFSHLLGANEKQAGELQNAAEAMIRPYNYNLFGEYAFQYDQAFDQYIQAVDTVRKTITKSPDSTLGEVECEDFGLLAMQVTNLDGANSSVQDTTGLDLLTTNAAKSIATDEISTLNLLKYACPASSTYEPTTRAEVLKRLASIHDSLFTIEMKDLYPTPAEVVGSSCELNVAKQK